MWSLERRLIVTAWLVWIGGLVGIAIDGYRKPRDHTVFDIYAVACDQWQAGEEIYPRQVKTGELYRYSPAFAVLTIPFAQLSPGLGNATWKVVNGLFFLLGVEYWRRRGMPETLSRMETASFYLLLVPTAMLSLHVGQVNLMMIGACLIGATAFAESRWTRLGAAFAAATLMKVFPLPGLLLYAQFRPARILLGFLGFLLVGLFLPLLTQNPDYVFSQNQAWFSHLVESNELNRERLRSLAKLLEVCGLEIAPKLYLLIAAFMGAVIALVSRVYAARTSPREMTTITLAWFTVWVLLYVPSTELVTYSLIAPFSAWSLVRAWRTPNAWGERILLVLAMIFMGPMVTDLAGRPLAGYADRHALQVVGALLFQLWLFLEFKKLKATHGVQTGRSPLRSI